MTAAFAVFTADENVLRREGDDTNVGGTGNNYFSVYLDDSVVG